MIDRSAGTSGPIEIDGYPSNPCQPFANYEEVNTLVENSWSRPDPLREIIDIYDFKKLLTNNIG